MHSAVVEAEATSALAGSGEGLGRRLLRDPVGITGAALVLLVALAGLIGPLVAPFDPAELHTADRLSPGGSVYLLGTDELGRDLLSRTLHGARISLYVGLLSVTVAMALGVSLGMIAGYARGRVDAVIMRIMDVIFAFPTILFALVLAAALGPDLRNLIVAIAIVYTPAFARIARGSTMVVAQQPYLESAIAVGANRRRLFAKHILPNIAAPLTVQFTVSLAYSILLEASLSFLGLGVQPPAASWGAMLSTGRAYLEQSLWPTSVPGMAIMLTVLGFNLLGDGLRDALDPKLRT